MMWFFLTAVISLLVSFSSANKPLDPKYLHRFYVEIKNGEVKHNIDVKNERYTNTIAMVREAHNKYKFKDGVIYFNNADNNIPEEIVKKTYYAVYDIKQHFIYQNITGPDFACLAWRTAQIPEFSAETRKIVAASKFIPENKRIGWIGNINSPLENVPEYYTRPMLLDFAKNYSNYFDFRHFPASLFLRNHPTYKSIPDLTKEFSYLLDIGGNGYSARLKYLLYSRRPIFFVEKTFVEYFYVDLVPWVHYIPVKQDLSDLVKQYEWALKYPKVTAQIAENAFQYASKNLVHEKFIDKVGAVMNYLLLDGH